MKAVIPDDVVVQTLRSDDLGLARELYMRMSNVFCLDTLPRMERNWEHAWFGPEMGIAEESTGIGTLDQPYTIRMHSPSTWGRLTAIEHDIEFNTEEMVEEVF